MLLDGEGTFRHWKYEGAFADQPWLDVAIYRVIRGRWVELKNKQMESKTGNIRRPGARNIRRKPVSFRRSR